MEGKSVLGRGLKSLIPDRKEESAKGARIVDLPISMVMPNENQPRYRFDEEKLSQLAASIKEKGILQPIIVRKVGEYYEIVAGERRYRASKMLGLGTIPSIVRTLDSEEVGELALIENIQRDDLGWIEKAIAYQNHMETYGLTQDQLSEKLGIARSMIANTLRLLALPQEIQDKIEEGALSFGHAKVLLSLKTSQEQLAMMANLLEGDFSVRELEDHVRATSPAKGPGKKLVSGTENPHVTALKEELEQNLGTKVKIQYNPKSHKGCVQIEYYSLDDLSRIVNQIQH